MVKLGFSLQNNYTMPMPEVLKLLRDIGFQAVSPLWHKDTPTEDVANAAIRSGLCLQSLHAPFRGLPQMWEVGAPILPDLIRSVDDCALYRIPVLVVHSWGGLQYSFREEDLHFEHFDQLVNHACRKGVRIAFENLEGPEYLAALMDRYRHLDAVGFCWDSGHELCYTPSIDFLKLYGDRLIMTHLNDNFGITDPGGQLQGTDDLHLLPYDGIASWPQTIRRLQQVRKQDILNFELKIRPKGDRCKTDLYSTVALEQYLTKAYEGACRAVSGYFA